VQANFKYLWLEFEERLTGTSGALPHSATGTLTIE